MMALPTSSSNGRKDGKVIKSDDDAEMYLGYYEFDDDDFTDLDLLAEELLSKLTTLYGKGEEEIDDYFSKRTWHDKDNNLVRLIVRKDLSYIVLGYMAGDADERLDEVKELLAEEKEAEQSSREAEEREENKGNYSGL